MFKKVNLVLIILSTVVILSSCRYQKLLKSKDHKLKYKSALEYYKKEDYARAMSLFEQLVPLYKGTAKGEEVEYYFSYCNYALGDYILAGYYFRRFAGSYPNSKHTEECHFLSAYCFYYDSPKTSLDQESTNRAMQEFQLFIGRYPKSPRIEECNKLTDELRQKLETKSYHNAKMYYNLRHYKSATIALNNSLKEFPDSHFREDIYYYILKSDYMYAINSIKSKQNERINKVLADYNTLVKAYPSTKYKKSIERIYKDSNRILKKITTK